MSEETGLASLKMFSLLAALFSPITWKQYISAQIKSKVCCSAVCKLLFTLIPVSSEASLLIKIKRKVLSAAERFSYINRNPWWSGSCHLHTKTWSRGSGSCPDTAVRFQFSRCIRKALLPCFLSLFIVLTTLCQGSDTIISSSQCLLQNINVSHGTEVLWVKRSGLLN